LEFIKNAKKNRNKEMYQSTSLWNIRNGTDLQLHMPKFEMKKLPKPFMRVGCLFSCPSGIYLKDKDGEVIGGQNSTSFHKVIFEGVSESKDDGPFKNIDEAQKGMWKLMSNVESDEKLQLTRQVFQVENMTWRVADIDNYMDGNPFTL
jgi:hypothetical protein